MVVPDPAALQASPLIDTSAFDCLTDEALLCTDEQHHNCVIIQLSEDGRLTWDYRMPAHGTPMDEWYGITSTWTLPVNVRAEPLRELITDHLDLLERVYYGHTVSWDGSNLVGELDEDGVAASDEFSAVLKVFVHDDDYLIELISPADWLEAIEAAFHGLDDEELEDVVREAIQDGEPFYGERSWVVVDLDEALAYAREIRDASEDPTDE